MIYTEDKCGGGGGYSYEFLSLYKLIINHTHLGEIINSKLIMITSCLKDYNKRFYNKEINSAAFCTI